MRRNNIIIGACILFSLIGFADALYLAIAHYTHATLPCTIVHGCEVVTRSSYSLFMGIPVAIFGVAHYVVFLLASLLLFEGNVWARIWLRMQSILGFLASVYFVYLQAVVIHAYCLYCLTSAVTSTLLFLLVWFGLQKYRKKEVESN